ncbi:MAG: gamma carbonic anhydrase family protein [Opitutae bacterium]|nr:gamma carbonic anhydrase family protein [Opitutae bacterium]
MDVKIRLEEFLSKKPTLAPSAYVSPTANVIGDVRLGDFSSVWYGSILRGDINYIEIGSHSNLQDGVIGHLSNDFPLIVGDFVTVGHGAVIHACQVEDECLIGMNSTVLDGAVIGKHSIIAAGTVVPQGMVVPKGSLVAGVPGQIKRTLTADQRAGIKGWAEKYIEVAKAHKNLI